MPIGKPHTQNTTTLQPKCRHWLHFNICLRLTLHHKSNFNSHAALAIMTDASKRQLSAIDRTTKKRTPLLRQNRQMSFQRIWLHPNVQQQKELPNRAWNNTWRPNSDGIGRGDRARAQRPIATNFFGNGSPNVVPTPQVAPPTRDIKHGCATTSSRTTPGDPFRLKLVAVTDREAKNQTRPISLEIGRGHLGHFGVKRSPQTNEARPTSLEIGRETPGHQN